MRKQLKNNTAMKTIKKYANVIIPAGIVLVNFVAGIAVAEVIMVVLA